MNTTSLLNTLAKIQDSLLQLAGSNPGQSTGSDAGENARPLNNDEVRQKLCTTVTQLQDALYKARLLKSELGGAEILKPAHAREVSAVARHPLLNDFVKNGSRLSHAPLRLDTDGDAIILRIYPSRSGEGVGSDVAAHENFLRQAYELLCVLVPGSIRPVNPYELKDAESAYAYAADVVEGPVPFLEPMILTASHVAAAYAVEYRGGKWPEAEALAASCPSYGKDYMENYLDWSRMAEKMNKADGLSLPRFVLTPELPPCPQNSGHGSVRRFPVAL